MKRIIQLMALITLIGFKGATAQNSAGEGHSVAVSIPEIAILDIEGKNGIEDINLAVNADDLEAGKVLKVLKRNASLWLNYTSIIASSGNQRNISVSADNIPDVDGLQLKLKTFAANNNGDGTLGATEGLIFPSVIPTNIITGIGSAYTGNGWKKGHKLKYILKFVGDFADLNVEDVNSTVTLTYTITD